MFVLLLFVRRRCEIFLRQVHQLKNGDGDYERQQVFIELTDEENANDIF
jgi:hypothetical protein